MNIHYFQHDHFEDLGYIGDWAKKNNFTTSVTRFDKDMILPQHPDYDWLVVMGGKMGVYDFDEYPWIKDEISFIRQAIDLGKVVIGICLGSQLVASALGAKVYKNAEPEMGFWPVYFNEEAKKDSVFRHFPPELTVLHMHSDIFELPEGAIAMTWNEITPCQAFRYGNHVFAFQFHFEVTPSNISCFLSETSHELVPGRYVQSTMLMNDLAVCCEPNNLIFAKVLDEITRSV